jgi:cytochrome c-type biogenesis protein
VLSGSCTFGFIAPILALITIQEKVMTGVTLIILFGIGHCLPIVIAGSSTALVKKLLESSTWNGAGMWFRKLAGATIMLLGLYFIATPFIPALQQI